MKKGTALRLVKDEIKRAVEEHGSFNSPHEAYAVLLEEVDELWAEIKAGKGETHRGVSEAVQIAAMAIRYLLDCCEEPRAAEHEQKVTDYYHDMKYVPRGGGCYSG